MESTRRQLLLATVFWFLSTQLETNAMEKRKARLYLIGGAADKSLKDMVALSGGADAHIVILPHASSIWRQTADKVTRQLLALGAGRVSVIRPHKDSVIPQDATCLFMTGGDQERLVRLLAKVGLTRQVHSMLQRGVLVAGTSAGAHVAPRIMIAGGMNEDKTLRSGAIDLKRGLGLLPDYVLTDSHHGERQRENRSRAALASLPRVRTSLGIDEDTAVYITGEQCTVFGVGSVALIRRSSRKPSRRLTGEARWLTIAQSATVESYKAGDTFEL